MGIGDIGHSDEPVSDPSNTELLAVGTTRTPPHVTATTQEQIDFLKTEAEHFYRAEIQAEQRASWLLTIASGGLVLVLNAFLTGPSHGLNARAQPFLMACSAFLFCTVALSLFAIWPLRGHRGKLQSPFGSPADAFKLPACEAIDLWIKQYGAHRLRAERKAVRVVWTVFFLGIAILFGATAVLKNAGLI